MKLILHIGSPKTGTTSIQNFLYWNSSELLNYGILFPVRKSVRPNHVLIMAGFVVPGAIQIPHNRFYLGNYRKYKSDFERFWAATLRDIRGFRPDTVIISVEQIFRDFSGKEQIPLDRFFETVFDEVKVVAYVRSPVSDYASRVSQMIRTGNPMLVPQVRNIRAVLEYYESRFPGCIRVNAFERNQLFNGDVLRDFIERYVPQLRDHANISKQRSYNTSLPDELLLKLQEQRLLLQPNGGMATIETRAFVSAISRRYAKLFANSKGKPVRLKSEVEEYLRVSAVDYLWLREKYGVTFSDLDYAAIRSMPPQFEHCARLTDVADVDQSRSPDLESLVPSMSIISRKTRTSIYLLRCQIERLYSLYVARSPVLRLKRFIQMSHSRKSVPSGE